MRVEVVDGKRAVLLDGVETSTSDARLVAASIVSAADEADRLDLQRGCREAHDFDESQPVASYGWAHCRRCRLRR